ncbi:MAG: cytochrome d ubiquinol oxidase subunit II, partial [Actinobacteria bacterium]|nr:cytochrome d ubiquinol oxidase subunit II [Actinomycetota bacterium]
MPYLWPLVFALAGLALYTVLGGADFGAGFWQLFATDDEIRDEAHHAMAPVWEANHVWLVFVLTVVWTAYPSAFGSIASTLSTPLFIAGIGIVLRGGAYALRAGTRTAAEQRRIDTLFAVSSILTPFALGTVVGGIAAGRVHVGNP